MQVWQLFTPSSEPSGYLDSSNLQQDLSLDPSGMNYTFKRSNAFKNLTTWRGSGLLCRKINSQASAISV